MNVRFDFTGKIVLVTGGGSGIGLASSRAFAAAGAHVVIADLSKDNGNAAVEAIRTAGGKGEFVHVDVADEAAVIALVEHIRSTFGRLDIAHNNAGIEALTVPLAEVPSDNWRRVIDVNLTSVFYCLKAEIPVMVAQGGGAIVNTASAAGLIGGFNLSVYTAAKHGVVGLTKSRSHGLRNQRGPSQRALPGGDRHSIPGAIAAAFFATADLRHSDDPLGDRRGDGASGDVAVFRCVVLCHRACISGRRWHSSGRHWHSFR